MLVDVDDIVLGHERVARVDVLFEHLAIEKRGIRQLQSFDPVFDGSLVISCPHRVVFCVGIIPYAPSLARWLTGTDADYALYRGIILRAGGGDDIHVLDVL